MPEYLDFVRNNSIEHFILKVKVLQLNFKSYITSPIPQIKIEKPTFLFSTARVQSKNNSVIYKLKNYKLCTNTKIASSKIPFKLA